MKPSLTEVSVNWSETCVKYLRYSYSKFIHLCKRRNQFFVSRWQRVFESHGSRQPCGVAGTDVAIGFSDAWLPLYQRRCGQVAEGTEVQVSWVARSRRGQIHLNILLLITWIQSMWLRWSRWSVHNPRDSEGSLFPLPSELKSSLPSKGRMFLKSFPERVQL